MADNSSPKKRPAKKAAGKNKSSERRAFPDISPTAWEHPADRAALQALRKIPALDMAIRKVVALFGEKSIRLAFKANAVKVTPKQYPWLHKALLDVCETLDTDEIPELYVTQTPLVNAGAVGMDKPFIVLNSSTIELLDRQECESVIAHEVAHIMSGHALYRTMLMLLLRFSFTRYPLADIAVKPLMYALLEWSRKAELSCDRAALLATQDREVVMGSLMRIAGGSRGEELDLDEFIIQSEEYRRNDDVISGVYKVLAAMGSTHPFAVARVGALTDWIESGEYDECLKGNYRTRGQDTETPYSEDVGDAAASYTVTVRDVVDDVGATVGNITSRMSGAWTRKDSEADKD